MLPVVFYDGRGRWTAARTLAERTWLGDVFGKYIPTFEYELVSLREHTKEELAVFEDAMSLVLFLDRCSIDGDLDIRAQAPEGFLESFDGLKPSLKRILGNVARIMLMRADMPREKIDEITDGFDKKEVKEMFGNFGGYSYRKTLKQGIEQGIERGIEQGIERGIEQGIEQGREEQSREGARRMKADGMDAALIAKYTGLPWEEIEKL